MVVDSTLVDRMSRRALVRYQCWPGTSIGCPRREGVPRSLLPAPFVTMEAVILRKQRRGSKRSVVVLGLSATTALCVTLEATRDVVYGPDYRFVLWNLVLGWIPLWLSLSIYDAYRGGARIIRLAPVILLWLLFLPNAPYLMTDLIHLREHLDAPRWFDALLLMLSGATGLLICFASMYLVHAVLRHRLGAVVAWKLIAAILVLVGAGLYLGRFLRWNSWDMLTQPVRRAEQVLPHLTNQDALVRALLLIGLMAGGLSLGYALFFRFVESRRSDTGAAS